MTSAPVVGITLRPQAGAEDRPERLIQNRSYLDAIEAAGAIPLPLPLLRDPERLRILYDRCDAICLPGGPDVEPQRYGEELRPDCEVSVAPELDAAELLLTRWLVAGDRPTLAICRGIQVLNVALGGTLWQDIAVQHAGDPAHHREERTLLVHRVRIAGGTLLHRILGRDSVEVNSLHHQAIDRVGEGLVVSATADDGLAEAVELPDRRFLLGVQWHPEELVGDHESARQLFAALVAAAR